MKTTQITGCKPNSAEWFSGFRVLAIAAAFLLATPVSAQTLLEDISYSTGSGGAVDVIMEFSGEYPEPQVFTTDNPARIALDLAGVANAMDERSLAIGSGATRSVTAVEAGGRTRVVIDLFRSASFDTRREGNRLIVSVAGGGSSAVAEQARNFPDSVQSVSRGSLSVANVDFRRGRGGEGRVIVSFNQPNAAVDLSKQGERIEISVHDATIPVQLEQRLDVLDFATPVDMIDTRAQGDNVRMTITVSGEYEHIAYQTGNQYVVEVQEYRPPELSPEEQVMQPPEYEGTRVTFNFQDIPVRAVLQLIADVSGLNVVVSDSVQGNVTLRLQNVPWDQALDIVLEAKGLDKQENGNVIWIAPAQEIADNRAQKLAALQEQRRLEPVTSAFIQVNYAKAADLAKIIGQAQSASDSDGGNGLLSDRGSVTVDERTNVLLVTDTQDRLSEIRELVNLLDRPVQQVQIESRIVVAQDNFSDELGVRFGLTAGYNDSHNNLFTTSGALSATDRMNNIGLANRLPPPWGAGATNDGSSTPVIIADNNFGLGTLVPQLGERLNVNLPASPTAARWAWSILTSDYLLDLELSALESEGRGQVVSSPRLITANQKEAFIQQGVEIPFQQDSASGATNISFKDAVLELRVTPLITPDDRVILDLDVKKDTIGELVPTEGGGFVPSIDTRNIVTQVLVDSGQTVVLGGIYEQTQRSDVNKVPLLGDLPGLGMFFRQRSSQDDKAELLIFVTPTILTDNSGYN